MLYRIQERLWEETLLAQGEEVLLCRSCVPELSLLEERPLRRINRFYIHAEDCFRRWCRKRLFPLADSARRSARASSRPFDPWEAVLEYEQKGEEDGDSLQLNLKFRGKGVKEGFLPLRWDLNSGFLYR